MIPLFFLFSQKKIKMSTTENLEVIPEVHDEENGSFQGHTSHQSSLAKKDIDKSSKLSSQPDKSSNSDFHKQKNDKSGPASDETRCTFISFVINMILR